MSASARDARPVRCPIHAYLPKCLLDRLRASLGGRTVLACAGVDALIAAAAAAGGGPAIVDPVLCGPVDRLLDTLSEARGRRVPIVLYTHASPTSMRLCFAWAHAGAPHLLLAGIDDDAIRVRTLCDAPPGTARTTDALVQHLDERLALVPARLAGSVRRLFVEPGAVLELDALVASACMTRRSVDRWLQRAGLAPPKRFVGAARLIRAHAALAAGEISLARAATRAGFPSERALALHARALAGASPSALRALCTDELHERVMRRLCRA